MPLLRYFGFAGSALALLLFGLSWYFPQPVSEPVRSGIDGPVIRISSVEQLPERVDIDTSLPTIVPENEEASITSAIGVRHGLPPLSPPSVLEFSERWPVATIPLRQTLVRGQHLRTQVTAFRKSSAS